MEHKITTFGKAKTQSSANNTFMDLVFATHNKNKFLEVQQLLPDQINLLPLAAIGCSEEIPETAATLQENAILKAKYVTELYGYPCFADDTGLIVRALQGAPGVFSARYAGPQKNTDDNIHKLLHELKDVENRKASFKTVIALNLSETQQIFIGEIKGVIAKERRGVEGFGYDPVFIPEADTRTFAELSLQEKNKLSHRALAIKQLTDYLIKVVRVSG